jgi:RAB6A-GEF complex partner protein 1
LPSPRQLFNEALGLESLKTAGGYLLVLHALDDEGESWGGGGGEGAGGDEDVIRLLSLARERGDWELCGELARFLMALDASGDALRRAVVRVGLRDKSHWGGRVEGDIETEGAGLSDGVGEAAVNGRSGSVITLKQAATAGK